MTKTNLLDAKTAAHLEIVIVLLFKPHMWTVLRNGVHYYYLMEFTMSFLTFLPQF